MIDVPVITFGTPDYQWLLKPLSLLFWKYWGDVRILYFSHTLSDDLPFNVEFRRLDFPNGWNWVEDFGAGMKQALASLPDPIVTITLMDMWPIRKLPQGKFQSLRRYMEAHDQVLRCRIGDDPGLNKHGRIIETWRGLNIATADRSDINVGLENGVVLAPSLWNRQLALGFLENFGIWDFEQFLTIKLPTDVISVWTRESVQVYAHTMTRDHARRLNLSHALFDRGDKELVKSVLPDGVEIIE